MKLKQLLNTTRISSLKTRRILVSELKFWHQKGRENDYNTSFSHHHHILDVKLSSVQQISRFCFHFYMDVLLCLYPCLAGCEQLLDGRYSIALAWYQGTEFPFPMGRIHHHIQYLTDVIMWLQTGLCVIGLEHLQSTLTLLFNLLNNGEVKFWGAFFVCFVGFGVFLRVCTVLHTSCTYP